jgi:hypothetical protein
MSKKPIKIDLFFLIHDETYTVAATRRFASARHILLFQPVHDNCYFFFNRFHNSDTVKVGT